MPERVTSRLARRACAAIAFALVLGLAAPAPSMAACAGKPCPLYLPMISGRHRLDLLDHGAAGQRWRHMGLTESIWDLAYDARGHLWAATTGGLVEWPPGAAEPTVHGRELVSHVTVAADGAIWSGGGGPLAGRAGGDWIERLAAGGARLRLTAADGLPDSTLTHLQADGQGTIFLGWWSAEDNLGSVGRLDEKGRPGSWVATGLPAGHRLGPMLPDGRGGAWLYTAAPKDQSPAGTLWTLDAQSRLSRAAGVPRSWDELVVVDMTLSPSGRPIALLDRGIQSDREGRGARLFEQDPQGAWLLLDLPIADAEARAVLSDAQGNLWVALREFMLVIEPAGRFRLLPSATDRLARPKAAEDLARVLDGLVTLATAPGGGMALAAPTVNGWLSLTRDGPPPDGPTIGAASLPGLPRELSLAEDGQAYLLCFDPAGFGVWRKPQPNQPWRPIAGVDGGTMGAARPLRLGPIAVGAAGEVWVADGDQLIQVGPDRVRRGTVLPADGLPGGTIRALLVGPDGSVWSGSELGLARRDPAGRWQIQDLPEKMARGILDIAASAGGDIWLVVASLADADRGQGGLVRLRPGQPSRLWTDEDLPPDVVGFGGAGLEHVAVGPGGAVWASGDQGVLRGDGEGPWTEVQAAGHGRALAVDAEGRLWMASSDRGVVRLAVDGSTWERFAGPTTVRGWVSDLAVDSRSGDLWIAILNSDNGADLLSRRSAAGEWHQLGSADLGDPTAGTTARHLAIAPDGTVLVVNSLDQVVIHGPSAHGVWMPQDRLSPLQSGPDAGCVAGDGTYWSGAGYGLVSYRPETGWRHIRSGDGLPPLDARVIDCAPDGSIWLATQRRNGLARPEPPRVGLWRPGSGWEDRSAALDIHGEGVQHLAWDAQGGLAALVSATGSDSEGASAIVLLRPPESARRLPPGDLETAQATDLTFTDDGALWIATDRGLWRWTDGDPAGPHKVVDPVIRDHGVRALALARGRLWAATSEGAAERLPDGRWRLYEEADGLLDQDLWGVEADSDGALWWMGRQSISILDP